MAKHSGNDTQDKEHFCKERTAIEKEELGKKKKKKTINSHQQDYIQ